MAIMYDIITYITLNANLGLNSICFFNSVTKEEVSVRMGSVFRDFGGRILSVVEIKRHPDYRMDQYYPEHNLAMVKVKH